MSRVPLKQLSAPSACDVSPFSRGARAHRCFAFIPSRTFHSIPNFPFCPERTGLLMTAALGHPAQSSFILVGTEWNWFSNFSSFSGLLFLLSDLVLDLLPVFPRVPSLPCKSPNHYPLCAITVSTLHPVFLMSASPLVYSFRGKAAALSLIPLLH